MVIRIAGHVACHHMAGHHIAGQRAGHMACNMAAMPPWPGLAPRRPRARGSCPGDPKPRLTRSRRASSTFSNFESCREFLVVGVASPKFNFVETVLNLREATPTTAAPTFADFEFRFLLISSFEFC